MLGWRDIWLCRFQLPGLGLFRQGYQGDVFLHSKNKGTFEAGDEVLLWRCVSVASGGTVVLYTLWYINIAIENHHFFMGNSTISMAIFNSYVSHCRRVYIYMCVCDYIYIYNR